MEITMATNEEYYQALLDKDSEYEGLFYVGVKTTGVFCRPTCPARKPKLENCEFFEAPQQALLAGFRPCKRCRPLSKTGDVSEIIQQLVEAVEAEPEKKWCSADVRALHIDPSTARRQFKNRFGMTFIEYARARRLGLALKHIKNGAPVIDAQINAGYESGSGFRDAFNRITGHAPSDAKDSRVLEAAWIDTPLGALIAIANESALLMLEFVDRRGLEKETERLQRKMKAAIIPGRNRVIECIEAEIAGYFDGTLTEFTTPLAFTGTAFQHSVWEALCGIPYGETRSYSQMAASIGKPTAVRATARANGANPMVIVVPCHRVIGANGDLTGYGGGLSRKQWLLNHEARAAAS